MSSVSAVNSLLSSTTTTAASTVNVSSILAAVAGVSTPGIDVAAAVAAGVYAARAPERIWQADQVTLSSQTAALTAIQTATTSLTTDMTALNSLTGPLSARSVSSSNTGVVTATAGSGTLSGSHSIAVTKLATTASWYSDLSPSATAALPSSTFKITNAAGDSATLSTGVGGVDTLNDLAAAINSATGSPSGKSLGITATVVSDSTGSRLAIISQTSGAAADFSITSAPTVTNSTGTWTSSSVAAHDSPLGADSFVLTTGAPGSTSDVTINVTAGQTFDDIAANINSQAPAVTASVVTDSSGAHLQIVSNDTNSFAVTEPGFGYSNAFHGSDASLTVDGVPITSSSNKVTGAIAGVTLNLTGTTSVLTPANITIASDASQVSTAITKFVSDYNNAIGLVNAQFSFSGSQGVLGSDPTVRSLQNSLLQVLNYVNTPATGTTSVSTLGDLGITAGTDGTLSLDTPTLNSALINNASDVQNFFQGASLNGFANAATTQLSGFTSPGSGAFTVDLNSISRTSADITSHISDFESIFIANQQRVLNATYSSAEIALQQLPTQLAQLQAMLGNNSKSS